MTTLPSRPRAGGRKFLPLGREVPGCPLRAPPGLPAGRRWPPSVASARAAAESSRNFMRSATTVFELASSLAWRGLQRGADGVPDLVEAVQLYDMISSSEQEKRFGAYRALALYNSTICMQALPSREAKKAAANLLLRAVEAIGDSITASIREHLSQRTIELEKELQPAPLRWRDPSTLASANPDATARIRALEPRYEGQLREVSEKLLDRGLFVPFAGHLHPERRIVATPRVQVIKVTAG